MTVTTVATGLFPTGEAHDYGIYAAGGVVWRGGEEHPALSNHGPEPFEILLVHRPKYHDWSFPKGKLEAGEFLPGCAVREIAEETGLQVSLGPKLAVTDYPVDGINKQVTYWLASVRNSPAVLARPYAEPAGEEEIDERRWVTIEEALHLLTHEFDRSLAARAGEVLEAGWGNSRPVVLLRHAKAKKRDKWKTDDALRPLKKRGKAQALAIVPTLSAFGISRVVSSPWKRCDQTVRPFLKATAIVGEYAEALSEAGFADNPAEAQQVLQLCAQEAFTKGGTAICTHRPVLGDLVEQVRQAALHDEYADNGEADWSMMDLAEILVVHCGLGDEEMPQVLSVERHLPEPPAGS